MNPRADHREFLPPPISPRRRGAMPAAMIAALALTALLAACSSLKDATSERPSELELMLQDWKPVQASGLEPGEDVTFEIVPDGRWHTSPIAAHRGDTLAVTAAGDAEVLPHRAIQFRIGSPYTEAGRRVLYVSSVGRFVVTEPGPFVFRYAAERVGPGFVGKIEVNVARVR